jgi:integrase
MALVTCIFAGGGGFFVFRAVSVRGRWGPFAGVQSPHGPPGRGYVAAMANNTSKTPRRTFGEIETRTRATVTNYRARYVGPDGNRHSRIFVADMAAQAWLVAEQRLIERDEWTPPKTRSVAATVTFYDYALDVIGARDLAPLTRYEYDRYLARFVAADPLGAMPVQATQPDDVRAWWNRVKEATGPTYAARVYGLVSSVFKQAAADRRITYSPCTIKGASVAKRQTAKTSATPAEVTAIMRALPERYRVMVLVAAWGGLRSGELRNLRRKDVDLAAGTVTVREQVQQVPKEGKVVRAVKTDAGRRTVHMPGHVVEALADQLTHRAAKGRDGLVFPSTVGTPISQSTFWEAWDKARRTVGRPDLRFHDLRHTAAMLAAATGATVAELQARLGHATPQAAMRYQHAANGADKRIAAALERLAAVG